MTDIEKAKLEQLNDDTVLLGAIKEVLLNNTEPIIDATRLSNEQLGAITRAKENAKEMIKDGFKEIERYKKVKISERLNENPAR
jgi:hypothetical protein